MLSVYNRFNISSLNFCVYVNARADLALKYDSLSNNINIIHHPYGMPKQGSLILDQKADMMQSGSECTLWYMTKISCFFHV